MKVLCSFKSSLKIASLIIAYAVSLVLPGSASAYTPVDPDARPIICFNPLPPGAIAGFDWQFDNSVAWPGNRFNDQVDEIWPTDETCDKTNRYKLNWPVSMASSVELAMAGTLGSAMHKVLKPMGTEYECGPMENISIDGEYDCSHLEKIGAPTGEDCEFITGTIAPSLTIAHVPCSDWELVDGPAYAPRTNQEAMPDLTPTNNSWAQTNFWAFDIDAWMDIADLEDGSTDELMQAAFDAEQSLQSGDLSTYGINSNLYENWIATGEAIHTERHRRAIREDLDTAEALVDAGRTMAQPPHHPWAAVAKAVIAAAQFGQDMDEARERSDTSRALEEELSIQQQRLEVEMISEQTPLPSGVENWHHDGVEENAIQLPASNDEGTSAFENLA